MIQDSLFS